MKRIKNARLRDAVFKTGLNQSEFADKFNIHRVLLSQIIGGIYIPNQKQMNQIAHALGMITTDLFDD